MKKNINTIFIFFLSVIAIQAQTITMTNTTVNVCQGAIENPGGYGSYTAGLDIVTTICPTTPGQCVRLSFTDFVLDEGYEDELIIYDGPNTSSQIIGIFSGDDVPGIIQSSTASPNGCITLRFVSDPFPFFTGIGFRANISCVTCEPPNPFTCSNAAPFCTNVQGGYTFPASTNISSEPGPNYGCLQSQPNPAWYYLEILNPGDLTIFMQSSPLEDIDFIVWGPFQSLNNVCIGQLTGANIVDCSYSGQPTEIANIPGAQTGEFYMFLITNFSNVPTNINFSQTGGTGSTNCSVFCEITNATANPSACNNATNTFNISGNINVANPPTTGTLIITNSSGGTEVINPPFTSPIAYNFNGIIATGGAETLTFSFSDSDCSFTTNYTSPQPCSPNICNVIATSNSPSCTGQIINLNATATAGATYSWTGPNGFTSTIQNPIINNVTPAMAGVYTVTLTLSNGCTATSSVSVVVNPTPETPVAGSNSPVCEGNPINLTASTINNVTYNWSGIGITPPIANLQNPSIPNSTVAMSGVYAVTATANGCTSPAGIVNVGVFSIPTTPVIAASANPICSGQNLVLSITSPALPTSGVIYSWSGPNGYSSTSSQPSIGNIQVNQAGTYSVFVDLGGCVSPTGNLSIAVNEAPIANAGPDVQLCSNTPIAIGSPGEPGVIYSWSPTNFISNPNISDPTITPINNTTNTSTVTYTLSATQNSCTSTDQMIVTTTPIPAATFAVPSGQCFSNNSFGFVALGEIPSTATFEWTFGSSANTPISNSRNPSNIVFNSTGTHPVTLTIENNGCISQPFTANIEVYRMPVANFIADVYSGCDPLNVSFTNLSESPGGLLTYTWDFGNQQFSTQTNPSIVYEQTGVFTVRLTATSAQGCVDRYTVTNLIRVDPSPRSAFNTDPFRETDITNPNVYFFDLSTNATNGFYLLSNGDTIPDLTTYYTFRDTGDYIITQIVSNEFGCSDTSSKMFRFNYGFKIYIPSSFTPNNDGKNDIFKVYGEDVKEFLMIIYSRWGQILYVSYDMDNGWDGRTALSDKISQQDTYIYYIEARDKLGKKVVHQGPLFLIR
jgi:gliding motility-associated-like protein